MPFIKNKKKLRHVGIIATFLLPAFLLYLIFMIYPIIDSVNISLTNWNGLSPTYDFVGLKNYRRILQDKYFWNAISNTLFWVILQLVLISLPTLILAFMITKVKLGMSFFRAGFYLPSIVSFSVAAVIWGKIYDPQMGPVNLMLNGMGLDFLAKNWLGNPKTVLPALVVASSWVQYGLYMVLFITGLQSIDPQYYEAAELDGANAFQKFWKITLPFLRNSMNVVLTLIVINAFKGFSMVWATTQGGPFYKSDLISTYIYREGFSSNKIASGAAGGILLAVIIIGTTAAFNIYRDWRAER